MSASDHKKNTYNVYSIFREFSIPLILGVLVALLLANLIPSHYRSFVHLVLIPGFEFFSHELTVEFLVNDVFMVFFFAIAAVEITRAFQPGKILANPLKALNPLIATIGGVLGPVAAFFALSFLLPMDGILSSEISRSDILRGWGIPTATDIALAWLAASLILGRKHPAITFLLLLAIVDDAIGLVIIAVFYSSPEYPVEPIYLLLVVFAIILAWQMRRRHVHNIWAYLIFAGIPSWMGLLLAHLHPALAFVFIVPFMPDTIPQTQDSSGQHRAQGVFTPSLTYFERKFEVFVDFGLFFFGLVNAGVGFSALNNITWLIFLSLLIGKIVGISFFSGLATLIGFKPPDGITAPVLLVISCIAGMGLTVSLFITGEAYTHLALNEPAKMGALFSVAMAFIAFFLARIFRLKIIS